MLKETTSFLKIDLTPLGNEVDKIALIFKTL